MAGAIALPKKFDGNDLKKESAQTALAYEHVSSRPSCP